MKQSNLYVLEEMPVIRAIMHLALPSVLSMLVNILYNLTDTFFIGKLHNEAMVAAVSISLPLFMVQMAIAGIFGFGGASFLSRLLGKKEFRRARETTTTAVFSSFVLSLVLGVAGILAIPLFLKATGASGETAAAARQYMFWILVGSPFVLLKFTMVQLIRGEGGARQAMYGLFIGTGANIVLDPILIFGFNMGVTGAAIATVIGQGLGMCYYIWYYLSKHAVAPPALKYLHPRWNIYREILLIGIPASLSQIMMSIGNTISYNLASAYGVSSVAALGVAARVFSIPIFVFIGVSIGVQALIGFNYGAGNFPRMKKAISTAVLINLGLSVVFTLLFALLPRQLISMITPIEQTVNIGRQVLGAYIYAIPFAGVGMIMMNSLQAMGKALPAFIVSISRQGLAYIPALLLLNKFFGFDGLIFALPLADTFTTLLAGIFVIVILSRLKHQEPAPSSRQYIQAVPADEA
ncbi:MAG: MATE family efflux transporter [Candidatus Cloacimonetes bacterium]|jgi:putative MATE family efflux protein|nr:MATE family efflux transporter [Candidatus Cloacimonadota bacterium]MDD3143706.1 MATE family efflux transporter [Candidatus Cloacimonadota bacterium]MDY0367661.1 MATE family efflux transporter [Candidatus Syntrophosphaera sp.]HOY84738.1 MATE family efflux transporter [Candidatus Syntrophosphaera sp.]HPH60848.1 MATE family efflux transporter [Candidatus Syntrophosphaera sp.]